MERSDFLRVINPFGRFPAAFALGIERILKERGSPNHMNVLTALINIVNRRDEEGQGLAEYALILALIAIVAIIALIFLGGAISQVLSTVGSSV